MNPLSEVEIRTELPEAELRVAWGWIGGESYWARGMPWEIFRRAAEHSLCFGLFVDGGLAGFARVVSDRATFAWLCDVWIDAPARGRGLGRRLMSAVMAHPELQGLRRWSLATRDAHSLYAGYGYGPVDAERGMEKLDPEVYSRGG